MSYRLANILFAACLGMANFAFGHYLGSTSQSKQGAGRGRAAECEPIYSAAVKCSAALSDALGAMKAAEIGLRTCAGMPPKEETE